MAVRAQYTAGTAAGEDVKGYKDEEDVPEDSVTETYTALRLEVDNWRWAGVPIYLRTGKRLARKVTEIAITLKPVPHLAFTGSGSVGVQPNQIVMTMQPNEGVSISLGAKIPGSTMRIRPVNMEFLYGTAFMSESPEAYERLIMDAMRGEATLLRRLRRFGVHQARQMAETSAIQTRFATRCGAARTQASAAASPDQRNKRLRGSSLWRQIDWDTPANRSKRAAGSQTCGHEHY